MKRVNNLNEIFGVVKNLSQAEQEALVTKIMGILGNNKEQVCNAQEETCGQMIDKAQREKPDCPHCAASGKMGFVTKRGFKGVSQRYYCKNCGKTFVCTTNTAYERTRKCADVWKKFIKMTIEGHSLARCSEECKIAYQTAFTWRHKVLNVFKQNQQSVSMTGRVEIDEMFIPISYKGNHVKGMLGSSRVRTSGEDNNLPRKSFKRGSDNKPKSPKERACVFCMIEDGCHSFYAAVPGTGAMTEKALNATLAKHVNKEKALVLADQYKVTQDYLHKNGYHFLTLLSNTSDNYHDHKPEIHDDLHLQHVNAFHRHIRRFLAKYCGVSTKYLANYISLYVWLRTLKAMKQERRAHEVSITRASASDCYITRKELEAYPAVPQCA